MKLEELIVRFVGGGIVGVLLGMVFLVASAQFAIIVHWAVGVAFMIGLLSSLLGLKYTLQTIAILLLVITVTIVFNISFLKAVGANLLNIAHTIGTLVVTQTTTSVNTAMTFWGATGALLAVYWGVTGAWEEARREVESS